MVYLDLSRRKLQYGRGSETLLQFQSLNRPLSLQKNGMQTITIVKGHMGRSLKLK
jgi:hypothetical protein